MRSVLQYAAELPQIVRAELEQLLVSFGAYWDKEHNADGTHSTITLDRGLFDDGTALLPSIAFAADLNTGIYRIGTDSLGFATGGYKRFQLDAGGMTFYTASPGASPQVCILRNDGTGIGTGAMLSFYLGGGEYGRIKSIYTASAQQLHFFNKDLTTPNLVIDANGYVGIGTAAPAAMLDVRGKIDTYDLDLSPVPFPQAFTAVLAGAGAGNVNAGDHYYYISYVTATGETNLSTGTPPYNTFGGGAGPLVTTTAGDGKVDIAVTASTDPRVTGIKIYRTKAGGAWYVVWVVATISNVSQTYRDNIADASLTAGAYARENLTVEYISVNGIRSFFPGMSSTALGYNSLAVLSTGGQNTAIGAYAGLYIDTGASNVCVGYAAGMALTGGGGNIAIGQWTLYSGAGGGGRNVAIGHDTLFYGNNNNYNVAIGYMTGFNVHSDSNVLVGYSSGYTLNTGASNVFIGYKSGYYETGSNKLFIDNAQRASEADGRAKALVYGIFDAATLNQRLTVNGVFTSLHQAYIHGTLYSSYAGANSDGNNIFIGGGGQSSLGEVGATHKGSYNYSHGFYALSSLTKGYYNVAIGGGALYANTTGQGNLALGMYALYSNQTGETNAAIGQNALFNNVSGSCNFAVGPSSQWSNVSGRANVGVGYGTLYANTTAWYCVAIGHNTLYDLNITADDSTGTNTAIGANTGRGIVTGVANTILGANVTGLAAALSSNIILANGGGTIKAQHDGTNWCLQGLVQLVGTTSSYPALKRSSAILQCRLADDSADAIFTAATFREQGRAYALGEPKAHTPVCTADAGTITETAVASHYSVVGKLCTILYELDITPSTTPSVIYVTVPINSSSLRNTTINSSIYRVGTGPDVAFCKGVVYASDSKICLYRSDFSGAAMNWAAVRYSIWLQVSYYIA